MSQFTLDLQRFAEDGGAAIPEAAAAETAPAAETGTESVTVNAGDQLADGQVLSSQVAAAMNKQMERHPELRQVYGQSLKAGKAAKAAPAQSAPAEKTIEDRWAEAKKGEFAELYGRDVQNAIQDRFRNQADSSKALEALEPMLKVLRDQHGVSTNEELSSRILDDDSLYEEEADRLGMTIEGYKSFKKMEQENERMKQQEQENIQQQLFRNHITKLAQQAEEFKKQLPSFDLMNELKTNERFRRLTSPEVGLSVEDAYFAIHRTEMMPQAMAIGMERAKVQMGQTLQAQRRRPAEGAMKTQGQPQAADFNLDPRSLSRSERNKVYELIHKGKMKWGG